MKVKDLIEELSKMNPEHEVIMQKDSEGNGYSPLHNLFDNSVYVPDSNWSGCIYVDELNSELIGQGFSEEDLCPDDERENGQKCVVLAPTN